jgi:hypothetical protein
MSNEIEKAENILRDLRAKREAAVAHGHSLGEQRVQLAFGAHALGDTKSRKRLDEINRESALHDSELRSLDCAIAEATARVERARQTEQQAAAQEKAGELRKTIAELAEVPAYIDRHLAAAAKGLLALEMGFKQLREQGVKHPDDMRVGLDVVRCINTWAMQLPRNWHSKLRDEVRFLAPAERRDFYSFTARRMTG